MLTSTNLKFIAKYIEKHGGMKNLLMTGVVHGTVLSGNTLSTTWGNSLRVSLMMKYIFSKVIGLNGKYILKVSGDDTLSRLP